MHLVRKANKTHYKQQHLHNASNVMV